jgi:RHS repeat-associated protein
VESGIHYATNRGYESVTGRFRQADKISSGAAVFPQMWNRYSYSLNEPITLTDPSGLSPIVPWIPFIPLPPQSINVSAGPDLPTPISTDSTVHRDLPNRTIGNDQTGPPPPPKIGSVDDIVKYWRAIVAWILSKGKCGEKLGPVVSRMNDLMSSENKIFLYDMRAPGVPQTRLDSGGTAADYFHDHPNDLAFTEYITRRDLNQTLVRADIFFSAAYFDLSAEGQAVLAFHELLHAAFQADNDELGKDFGMPHDDIDGWIEKGCPD